MRILDMEWDLPELSHRAWVEMRECLNNDSKKDKLMNNLWARDFLIKGMASKYYYSVESEIKMEIEGQMIAYLTEKSGKYLSPEVGLGAKGDRESGESGI